MDYEQDRLLAEQKSHQQVFDRFTFSWRKWWHLNRYHFELSLVMKVVVLHLVTEAVRHHTAKPCSHRFWIMLFGMTGKRLSTLIALRKDGGPLGGEVVQNCTSKPYLYRFWIMLIGVAC
jgi:hypothetical protein